MANMSDDAREYDYSMALGNFENLMFHAKQPSNIYRVLYVTGWQLDPG